MIKYYTINEYIMAYPDVTRFKIFRVSDKYLFTVKEIKENTVVLNTNVNLEVDRTSEEYLVHESNYGEDYSIPKVQRYSPSEINKPATSLNLKKEITTRLHNKTTFVFGRLLKEEFYPFNEDLETADESDLVAKITYNYKFDTTTNEVSSRVETMFWYNELDEVCATKILPKLYTDHMGMDEAERRRKNIIKGLKHDLDKMTKLAAASSSPEVALATKNATKALITATAPYIDAYEKYGEMAILTFLAAYQNLLLESPVSASMNVRQYMLAKIDFLTQEQSNPDLYKGSLL